MRPALIPARHAGTRLTYPGRLSWPWCWLFTELVYLSTDSQSPILVATTWSQVQRPNCYPTKPWSVTSWGGVDKWRQTVWCAIQCKKLGNIKLTLKTTSDWRISCASFSTVWHQRKCYLAVATQMDSQCMLTSLLSSYTKQISGAKTEKALIFFHHILNASHVTITTHILLVIPTWVYRVGGPIKSKPSKFLLRVPMKTMVKN